MYNGAAAVHPMYDYSIWLDPLFWQALGESMGWKTGYYEYGSANEAIEMSPWQAKWHRFIDHLASGKDIESFFAPL